MKKLLPLFLLALIACSSDDGNDNGISSSSSPYSSSSNAASTLTIINSSDFALDNVKWSDVLFGKIEANSRATKDAEHGSDYITFSVPSKNNLLARTAVQTFEQKLNDTIHIMNNTPVTETNTGISFPNTERLVNIKKTETPKVGEISILEKDDISAKLYVEIINEGYPEWTEGGICYSTSLSNVKSSNCSKTKSNEKFFTRQLEELTPSTKYYAVAYISNNEHPVYYSKEIEFETPIPAYKINTAWYNASQTEFTISTAEELAGLAKLVNDGNSFINKTVNLGADIKLNSTIVWTPIGIWNLDNSRIPFNGTFDGKGFEVSGVYINNLNTDMGLFGYVGFNGTIKNVGVIASDIYDTSDYDYCVGGLVGHNQGGISNSYFSGTVRGGNNSYVGGLVGNNDGGTISNSYSMSTVAGGYSHSGGLVGHSSGTISSSYSMGTVYGEMTTGGLVGRNTGIINNSYSTGSATGKAVGGLVGFNQGTINSSYSTGTVRGLKNNEDDTLVEYAGGLVGGNRGGVISNSYSTSAVSGENYVGGLAGWTEGAINNSYSIGIVTGRGSRIGGMVGSWDSGTITNSYYDRETSGQSDYRGTPRTTAQMKTQSTFVNWDFTTIWGLSSTGNNGYPYLLENLPK